MSADQYTVLESGLGLAPDGSEYVPARHEHLLRNEPTRYAELVSNVSGYGIYMMDLDGYILSWNSGAANITGYTEREVLGMPQSKIAGDPAVADGSFQRAMHFARLNNHCSEIQTRSKRNGEHYFARITLDVVRDATGEITGFIEVFSDITEQKEHEDALYQRATRDPLTGVFNRGHFVEMANMEIERARRFAEPLSVALFDIDHLKAINQTYGTAAGDKAIIALTKSIAGYIRKIDFVGRISGGQFAMLFPRANKAPALEVSRRLRVIIAEQNVDIGEAALNFTVSIGIASLRPTTRGLPDLMRNADAALHKAKREGRNRAEAWFE